MRPFINKHIMKKYILISLCLLTAAGSFAQNKDFKFKFYGQIRTDFYPTLFIVDSFQVIKTDMGTI